MARNPIQNIKNPRTLTPWRLNLKHPRTLKTLNPAGKIAQTCCVCVFVYPLVTRTLLSEFFGGGWTLQERCDVHPDGTGLYQESTMAIETCWYCTFASTARLNSRQLQYIAIWIRYGRIFLLYICECICCIMITCRKCQNLRSRVAKTDFQRNVRLRCPIRMRPSRIGWIGSCDAWSPSVTCGIPRGIPWDPLVLVGQPGVHIPLRKLVVVTGLLRIYRYFDSFWFARLIDQRFFFQWIPMICWWYGTLQEEHKKLAWLVRCTTVTQLRANFWNCSQNPWNSISLCGIENAIARLKEHNKQKR